MSMRALTVVPREADSLEVSDVPAPTAQDGELLVDGIAVGVCGTDREIARGEFGSAPPGAERLVIGHESLGRVREAPPGSGFVPGDLVVGIVRRPDPEPCGACAHDEFDMCRNGRYTERGIKELHGYASEQWTVAARYAVRLDASLEDVGMLLEPTTIVAKAWDHIEHIGGRAWFEPKTLLVAGAGPIGLLAALLGVQRGLDVHVLDQVTGGPKPRLVADLGATYHTTSIPEIAAKVRPDIVVEATGVPQLVLDSMANNTAAGVVCLTGVSPVSRPVEVDAGSLSRDIVLRNDVVFGTVNANRGHYDLAVRALGQADHGWLRGMITRRLPLDRAEEAFEQDAEEIKVVIDL
jgi:glucose 1-dehydrogenase